jgi:hypothetical protein
LFSLPCALFFQRESATVPFSEASALFDLRQKYKSGIVNDFHTLGSLFCQRAEINSFIFSRVRTLLAKWGVFLRIRKVSEPLL